MSSDEPVFRETPGKALLIIGEGGIAVVAIALGWLIGRPPATTLSWDHEAALLGVAATLPLILLLVGVNSLPRRWTHAFHWIVDELLVPLFRDWTLLEMALVSLLAGVGEELLFRGLLQSQLAAWFGPTAGLVMAGLVFGLAHPISKTYFILATAIGIYLGWLWIASGNLLVPIVVHALYDFLAMVILVRRRAGS